jgi:hypothetical protein
MVICAMQRARSFTIAAHILVLVTTSACRGEPRPAREAPVTLEAAPAPVERERDAGVDAASLAASDGDGDGDGVAGSIAAIDKLTATGVSECDPLVREISLLYRCRAVQGARAAWQEWALATETLLAAKVPKQRKSDACRKALVELHARFDGCFAERAPPHADPR